MEGISRTALAVAAVRAQESDRPDRLFDDPYARRFLAAVPGAFDAEREAYERAGAAASALAAYGENVVLRTRFFDEYSLEATRAGLRQVVLLAAGLDTRAYRLDWPPGTIVYEVDLPEPLALKDGILPHCARRRPVAADLRTDWTGPLRDAGFEPAVPSAWLAEGLFLYLSSGEARTLLDVITTFSPPGSRLAIDLDDDSARPAAGRLPALSSYADLWKGGLPETPAWLGHHGWRTHSPDLAELTARYGRQIRSTGTLLTAERRRKA